ncbi:MAG: adenosylcobinamide amidohydrolase [Patulibacter sp.]
MARWPDAAELLDVDPRPVADADAIAPLVVPFGDPAVERRVLSSAVLGGGLTVARSWLCATVASDYARTDPSADLQHRAEAAGAPAPTVGMLTAVDVRRVIRRVRGCATVHATVGVGCGIAAAGTRMPDWAPVGTINLLVQVDAPLDDTALIGAMQTVVEAKVQALAEAGIAARNGAGFATGTPTDAVCIAVPPGGGVPFAGTATVIGGDIAHAVHAAVLTGALADRAGFEATRSDR